jgi:indolepyruvate ferredoxin oxidoreductase, beta subunit
MDHNINIIIVGVGGQGTLLTSRILGCAAIRSGMDVKINEIHGMAQRGGSVVSYVRIGSKIYSPVIESGCADMMLAFEELEALRWVDRLGAGGKLILNTQKIDPMPVIMRKAEYPKNIVDILRKISNNIITIDALDLSKKAGSIKTVNVVMIGRLAKELGYDKNIFIEAIKETVPGKSIELNLKAFELGYDQQEVAL